MKSKGFVMFVMSVAVMAMILLPTVAIANNANAGQQSKQNASSTTHEGLTWGIVLGGVAIGIVAIATGGVVPAVAISVGVGAPLFGAIIDAVSGNNNQDSK